MTAYLLGIDVGTTGSKALLIDADGVVKASATTEYPMFTPQPLWSEQNPGDWWDATVTSIRRGCTPITTRATGHCTRRWPPSSRRWRGW